MEILVAIRCVMTSIVFPLRSEHERHAIQCPYIRGEYTENVPLESTEASHPAHVCAKEGDRIVCLGTSMGTELVAVGTEQGHIILLDLDHGLLIMVIQYIIYL